jgi:hypothetical protein
MTTVKKDYSFTGFLEMLGKYKIMVAFLVLTLFISIATPKFLTWVNIL